MKITRQAFDSMLSQAQGELPNESCGYLLGQGDCVTQNFRMTNVDHSREHFSFDPAEQFSAIRFARKASLRVLANWHSHPATPSRPSPEDIRLANDPNIVYFILSLAEAEPVLNAFQIKAGQVKKLSLEII